MRNPHRISTRFARLQALSTDRRQARLARFADPATAEDDYFRLANRNR